MFKKGILASVATVLMMGGIAYGISSFTSQSKTCPLEGTPACPKNSATQAQAGVLGVLSHDKAVASADLPPCCLKK